MWARLVTLLTATVAAGSLALPASAAVPPAFSLTLFPVKVVVPLGQQQVTFGLLNGGSEPEHVVVTAQDAWLSPAEKLFDLQPGDRHYVQARIVVPAVHDAGDHDSLVMFGVPGSGSGPITINRALAAMVIIETSGRAHHGLTFDGLKMPTLVDSTLASPVELSVRANNSAGNVHESVQPMADVGGQRVAFEPAVLVRGSTRVLRALWSPPLACLCRVQVQGLATNAVVFPFRAAVGLLGLLLLGVLVGRRLRHMSGVRPI